MNSHVPTRPAAGGNATLRREFLQHVAASMAVLGLSSCAGSGRRAAPAGKVQDLFDLRDRAHAVLSPSAIDYLEGGSESCATLRANREIFDRVALRCRRLVDVSQIDTRVRLFDHALDAPIVLAPVGFQGLFHPQGELASVSAAAERNLLAMVSTASTYSVGEIHTAVRRPTWFQLYPTPERRITEGLLRRAADAGCTAVVLTLDTPVIGQRKAHGDFLGELLLAERVRMGNYEGLRTTEPITDPTLTWAMVGWLRAHTSARIVLKGIVTREDARRALEAGVDAVVVSNHGGRQEDSGRSTLECLPEVVDELGAKMPVLIDSGFRRGADVFKALALGARAVAIGRPYLWGLAADGESGVGLALDLLKAELVRTMQLAGTPTIASIDRSFVTEARSSAGPAAFPGG